MTARYFDEKDHWISADEAVSMKLADGLYDMGEKPETEPKTAGEVYQYFNNRLQTQPQNQNKDMALLEELKKMPTFKDVNSEAELLMKAQQPRQKPWRKPTRRTRRKPRQPKQPRWRLL